MSRLTPLLLLPLLGCSQLFGDGALFGDRSADDDDDGNAAESGDDTDGADCGDSPDEVTGWTLSGVARDLETSQTVSSSDGLCATAVDPSPMLSGEPPSELATAPVCDGGDFAIHNLGDIPATFMLVVIDDCDSGQDTVMPSGSAVDLHDVGSLGAGGVYDMTASTAPGPAMVVTRAYQETLEAELVDFSGSLDAEGFLGGRLLDAGRSPVGGATITCGACDALTVSYADGDPSDGLFETDGRANSATTSGGGGWFLLPGAPFATYEVESGGSDRWDASLWPPLAGYAFFWDFVAAD